MLTGEDTLMYVRPGVPFNRQILKRESYQYFPYETGSDEWSHLLIIDMPIKTGPLVTLEMKLTFPFYSEKIRIYYQDILALSEMYYNSGAAGKERFTGDMNADVKLMAHIDGRTAISLLYNYLCYPYRPWGYFSKDKYSLHTVRVDVKREF